MYRNARGILGPYPARARQKGPPIAAFLQVPLPGYQPGAGWAVALLWSERTQARSRLSPLALVHKQVLSIAVEGERIQWESPARWPTSAYRRAFVQTRDAHLSTLAADA